MQNYVNTQYCNSGSKQKRYGVRLTVIQNSQDITNNRSNVTIIFELGGAGALGLTTDYTGSSMNGYTYYGNIYINGTSVATGSHTGNMNNSTVATIATWTDNINHNPDGTLSINVKGVFTGGVSSQANGGEASGTVYFDNIPRASSVACTTANIGAKPTITITSAVSSFTHKIYYEFGTITKTLIADSGLTGNTTITYNNWTIPTTFYAQIPNSQSGTGNIICETYSGTTPIGTDSVPFTANVPSSAKPNISNPTIVDTDTVSKNTIQLYVVGKSALKFTFPTFSTSYGSTLKNYTLNINGTQVYSGTETTYTMRTTISQTSNNYELIITDSRGISNTTNLQPFTAYAYTEPKINTFTAERNSTTDTTVNITYNAAITNINSNNRNAKTFKIEYRQTGSTGDWTPVTTITNTYTPNSTVNTTNVSADNTYDFRITATDSYGSVTATTQVSTSSTLLNFNANGATLAFGKASESSTDIEFAIPTDFQKPIKFNSTIKGKRFNASGTGYMKLFTITINGANYVQAMTFDLIQKNRSASGRIILKASTATSPVTNGFMINQFYFEGSSNLYYCYNNSSNPSSVDIYVQKYDASDDIEITNFKLGEYNSNVVITWAGTRVASLPTGYGSASRRAGQYQYGVTSTGTNNSSSNLMTSAGVQAAIAHIIPYTLYDDANGTNGTVTLSDSPANYAYIEVLYNSTQNSITRWDSVKIPNPNGKYFTCIVSWIYNNSSGATQTITQINQFVVSGTNYVISRGECSGWNVEGGSTWSGMSGSAFYICKVIGYK